MDECWETTKCELPEKTKAILLYIGGLAGAANGEIAKLMVVPRSWDFGALTGCALKSDFVAAYYRGASASFDYPYMPRDGY